MTAIETLQVINADLDAEREERLHIIRNAYRGARLRNGSPEKEKLEDLGSLAETVATLSEEPENSLKTKAKDTDTEHMKLFEEMVRFCSLFGKLFGIDFIFNCRLERKGTYWFTLLILCSVWVCLPYTCYMHFRNGDYVRILEPLVIFGFVISSTHKQYTYFKYLKEKIALLFHLRSVCQRTTEGSSRGNILTTGLRRNLKFMKFYSLVLLMATGFYLVVPLKVYFVDMELMSLITMEIVFCDQSTTLGFAVANVVQAIMGSSAGCYAMLYGLVFIVLIFNYDLGANLLAEDFKDLDKMWTGKMKVSLAYKHAFLRNICMKRQDMNNYLDTIKKIFAAKLFFYFCANYFSQIICMYQTIIRNWQGGYAAFIGIFFEMMFYCFMGTQLSIADDRLCYVIYDTKWYEYDLTSQNVILVILMEAQRTRDIELGFIGPLNLVTFITIVKSIYSYYTVLSEML